MRQIEFAKLQGMGNDFLVVEVEEVAALRAAREMSLAMCDRNFGAGADGLIFVTRARHGDADFASRTFNSDGSEAGVSGNGTRCLAAYLYHKGAWGEPLIRIATASGVKTGRLVGRDGTHFGFEFDMGEPRFKSSDVPMALERPLDRVVRYPLRIGGDVLEVTCLSMGNPQCVVFVPDLKAVNLAEIGPLLEDHPLFPDRANVEFARVISPSEIEILIWERGAGHTLSSGTGSCASAVAASLNNLAGREVRVRTEGGPLAVVWRDDNTVALTGSADVIYEARWLRGF